MRDNDITEGFESLFPGGLYAQVIKSFDELCKEHGGGVLRGTIGLHAWGRLTASQRACALPSVLDSYVGVVLEQENARTLDAEARKNGKSYLGDHDVVVLSDALFPVTEFLGKGIDVHVEVNAEALANVLSELELLQHRVAMLRNQAGDQ